jgi:uncharacterized iron-regulated protein
MLKPISHFLFLTLFAMIGLTTQVACASPWKTNALYDGTALSEVALKEVAAKIEPGTVVIVSETHNFKPHHQKQVEFLEALASSGKEKISVGMEFFAHGVQEAIDRFLDGTLPEADFLKEAQWGAGNPFENYRRQVLFPREHGGRTIGLNAARSFTGKISKVGLAGLSEEEKRELPPQFTLGNALYFERFKETMANHVPPEALNRYFEAQSVWDETMAWVSTEFLRTHPEQILVIITGDFHASYGGGLPDRLRARGAKVVVVSQANLTDLSEDEERAEIEPDAKAGPRGEFVWVSRE